VPVGPLLASLAKPVAGAQPDAVIEEEAAVVGPHHPVRAVVFDLDGVIVDTEPWWEDARRGVAEAAGATWTAADEAAIKGTNSPEWAALLAAHIATRVGRGSPEVAGPDAPAVERAVVDAIVARYRSERPPIIEAGVRAARRLATTHPLAVASSAHPVVIAAALAATALTAVFREVVSADEVGRGKPAPDVYLEAARRLGVPPAACLVIEDSAPGVRAGRAAGMRVVLVPAAGHPPAPGAEAESTLVLGSLDELDGPCLAALEAGDPA
jgi:HAD superfamily hydrolase (TIGR01509 family)